MQEKLLNLQEAALNEIKDTSSIEAVESLRVKYLGKKGEITAILKEMGKLSAEERPVIGQVANKVRESIEGSISSKKEELKPFILTIFLFALGYLGLMVSLWPWIVPYEISLWQAASNPEALSLILLGVLFLLPVTLGYTAYSYYVFRGKSSHYYD